MHTLHHTDQIIQADWLEMVPIRVEEESVILCRSGNGEMPVKHCWNDNGAGVTWVGLAVQGEEIGYVEGAIQSEFHVLLSAARGMRMIGDSECSNVDGFACC